MNARDRANFAVHIIGLTVASGLGIFIGYIFMTRVIAFPVELSWSVVTFTILSTTPLLIRGLIIYYKNKYSSNIYKPAKLLNKERPRLFTVFLNMQILIIGFIALFQVFDGLKSNGNIAWMILCSVVGVSFPIWVAIRTRPLGEYFASIWDKNAER